MLRAAILESSETTPQRLREKGELLQFWRVIAGCVVASGMQDGRRVDLLGCRVCEAPREGAALLKELWTLTAVPFAASDDALGGYMLATFMEEPNSGTLSIISSSIKGMDLYFKRSVTERSAGVQGLGLRAEGPHRHTQLPAHDAFVLVAATGML